MAKRPSLPKYFITATSVIRSLVPPWNLKPPPHRIEPRNAYATAGIAEWNPYPPPLIGFVEYCFRHKLPPMQPDGHRCVFSPASRDCRNSSLWYSSPTVSGTYGKSLHATLTFSVWNRPMPRWMVATPTVTINQFGKLLAPGETICYQMELLFETLVHPLEK